MAYLQGQLPLFQKALNDAYYAGNTANNNVLLAQQNLEAANKRFNDESAIIKEATYNLELARAEKEIADNDVDILLRQGADILPFAAAPLSNQEIAEDGTLSVNSWSELS